MASSPALKVYNPRGEYVAACKYAEDAAAVAQAYGDGATIRLGHTSKAEALYTVGEHDDGDSYDEAAEIVHRALYALVRPS